MTHTINAMRSAILASALLGQPVLAQDRVAISIGSGEGAEILYVSPGDRRAPRNALGIVPDTKAPVMAVQTVIQASQGRVPRVHAHTKAKKDLGGADGSAAGYGSTRPSNQRKSDLTPATGQPRPR